MKIKRKKSERQKLVDRLDELFSIVIRTRDNFQCQKDNCTGKGKHMQCAHIFTRGKMSTRWDLDNAFTMCYYHHILWSHRKGVEFTMWCIEKLGKKKFLALQKRSNTAVPMTIEKMKEIKCFLEKKLIEYQNITKDKIF